MIEEPQTNSNVSSAWAGRSRFKRWSIRLAVGLAVVALVGGGLLGVAEYRTAQPSFCASCHVMTPYYESWQADLHGRKLGVACVECHYAPGERTTFNAKFRGLSQATSYFSGRYGATRPRAHVSNESCMTSKCHGDEEFMDKPLMLGSVSFIHSRHLRSSKQHDESNQQRLDELAGSLRMLLGDDRFSELESIAHECGPAKARYDRLVALCTEWNKEIDRSQLVEFSQLYHRRIRVLQLADLQCTNCHTASHHGDNAPDEVSEHHFSVSRSTCYTCHFNNEGFNTGTTRCVSCHTLPSEKMTVHKQVKAEQTEHFKSSELATKTVQMDHQMILDRKVDCITCHADVALDGSAVTRRDCEHCHNQPKFFQDWEEPFTLDTVAHYHRVHVHQHRAVCLDCHSEIKHGLARETADESHFDFLTSAMANCTHCHPDHHTDQVQLLMGVGGRGLPKSDPNPMFGSRTNCYGCHTQEAVDRSGAKVVKATQSGCVACHGERYEEILEQWMAGMEMAQNEAEEAVAAARTAIDADTDATPEAHVRAVRLLNIAETDLLLVKRANGIHNVTYAVELLDSVVEHSQKAIAALKEK